MTSRPDREAAVGPGSGPAASQRKLLYIDMAYTVEMVRRMNRGQFFDARHSEGYFGKVWAVHPLADIGGKRSAEIQTIIWSENQTIIEGVSASLGLPRFLLPLDFLVSQGRLLRRLAQIVRTNSIDIIAASDSYYSGLVGLILKKLTGRPLTVSVFGNPDELYEATGVLMMPRLFRFRWVERLVARAVLSRADLIIAQNRNNMAFARANGGRGEALIVPAARHVEASHLTLPSQRGEPETFARLGINRATPVMLYVGRLLPLKQPDSAIRAMAMVIKRRPQAVGLLAGDGPMRPELERLIVELGVEGRIHLLGPTDQDELHRLIPASITVSPLTGLALVECGLGGSPIVAYDRDWQSEFIDDGKNGFIVPFLDHEAMADRVVTIADDPLLHQQMGIAVREAALKLSDARSYLDQEHRALDRLLRREPQT